ncbi:hypothetical protein SARC_02818 [Sphaeroforma arctica JP610]|uniref:Uncharacterized protein n=1 Tax=Sphaeroforma arctica JP610 TaxID=667725 RepID=A0A0L0G9L9_9EUKA|nr:hypothetical protein SARC_02818 [Sphaeroforma arctica JP610]KNC84963.1 hypothetical protein SARC_02818 [Sphaeroforma arctica JP610]|eukprot:XP_014158865.1 hypothetical protein SARC_02818 [Sphaeroforma arctica JP610]
MLYPDAKVSEALCGPRGACNYRINSEPNDSFRRRYYPLEAYDRGYGMKIDQHHNVFKNNHRKLRQDIMGEFNRLRLTVQARTNFQHNSNAAGNARPANAQNEAGSNIQHNDIHEPHGSHEACLNKGIRTLWQVWQEYDAGLYGSKPASFFTDSERGRVKCTYSLRLCFWRTMEKLTARGNSAQKAIEKIQDAYGTALSVTAICRACRTDKDMAEIQ